MIERGQVLLLGATGRTGRLALAQLLERQVRVRVIVRSAAKLPPELAHSALLEVRQAELFSLSGEEMAAHVGGCAAVISCLGHTLSFRGIFGRPRNLVTLAVKKVCDAIVGLRPGKPVKFILMGSVSVNSPYGREARRGPIERAILWLLRALVPPAKDNQTALDYLFCGVGTTNPWVEWVAIRPDSLKDGPVSGYALHENLVNSLSAPGQTRRANVAHLMCELATNSALWAQWRFKLPVIVNTDEPR